MKIKRVNNVITILIVVLLIILFSLIFGIIKKLNNEVEGAITLDTIENYNYKLTDSDTEYYKENFKELKKVLENENINEEEYAKLLTKLFITDFYSLKSAVNKNDVGGVQFVKSDYQETFIKKAKDSIYNSVENNMYNDRKQKLPNVKQVEILNTEKIKTETDENAYKLTATIIYEENLGYTEKVEIILIHKDNILEIASLEEIGN